MSLYQICFSPTGGTKKAAEILGSVWEEPADMIDLSLAGQDYAGYSFREDDICIISVPSFGGRVPKCAVERLSHMHGGNAYAVLIAVYGNRAYEDTLMELKDILTGCGFRCTAAVAAVAEHSIMRQYGKGRPDSQDRQELLQFGEMIKDKLSGQEYRESVKVPGNTTYKEYHVIPMHPKAGKGCTKCGLCAEKCPVSAIPKEEPDKLDTDICISCMRCVAVCPQKARTLNPVVLFAASQKLKKACSERKKNEVFL